MADATNIKIGACSVSFDGVDLGHTYGGVTLNYAPEYADILADQFGKTPIDKVLIGEVWTAKVKLAESKVANLGIAVPAGTISGDKVTVGKDAGFRLSTVAKQLVLHPLCNLASNRDDDVVFYKAVVHGEVEIGYNNEDERVFEVEFVALVDTTKSNGAYLGLMGDSA